MFKFRRILTLICLPILAISSVLYGNSIFLKDVKVNVPVESYEIGEEVITVTILKDHISSVQTVFNKESHNSDVITLKNGDIFSCKIIELLSNTILAEFKKKLIRLYPPKTHNRNIQNGEFKKNKTQDSSYEDLGLVFLEDLEKEEIEKSNKSEMFEENQSENILFSEIKKNLFEEIKGSGNSKIDTPSAEKPVSHNDMIEKMLNSKPTVKTEKKDVRLLPKVQPKITQDKRLGLVKGGILKRGRPLAACKIRLVLLRNKGGVFYKDKQSGRKLENITDETGTYKFYNVLPGYYKIYWMPPSESSWIRRVSMEPDVLVQTGELSTLPPLETNQRIIN